MLTIIPMMVFVYLVLQLLFSRADWAFVITWVLSIVSYGPLERARYLYQRRFLLRPHVKLSIFTTFSWIFWVVLQATILAILAYLMACQCQTDAWNAFIFSMSTLVLIFIFHKLDSTSWGQSIYLFPYAYMRLAIPIGLLHSLLLIYIPRLFEAPSIWSKRVFDGLQHFIRFGGQAWRGEICSAYVHLDESLTQVFMSLPFPFNEIVSIVLRTEMVYGFLVLLYAWNAYRLARWHTIKHRVEIPPV